MLGFIVFYNSISLNHANILFFYDFVNIISPRSTPPHSVFSILLISNYLKKVAGDQVRRRLCINTTHTVSKQLH